MRTVPEQVSDWTLELTQLLNENFKKYSIKMLETYTSDYATKRTKRIKDGTEKLTQFVIRPGRKYYKINQQEWENGEYRDTSVHCFVDKNTGEVYKPKSWKGPEKKSRYDLRIIKEREFAFKNVDWAGGWLYTRFFHCANQRQELEVN